MEDAALLEGSELDLESEFIKENVKKKWEEFKDALLRNGGEMGLFFCVQYLSMFILLAMDIWWEFFWLYCVAK